MPGAQGQAGRPVKFPGRFEIIRHCRDMRIETATKQGVHLQRVLDEDTGEVHLYGYAEAL